MPFNDPGVGGDRIDYEAVNGALLLFTVHAVEDGITTTFGEKTAVRCDVAVLDGPLKGEVFDNALVFPLVLLGQLKGSVGEMVIGRLGKGTAKPGQKPPWTLTAANPSDREVGERYLEYAKVKAAQEEEPF